LTVGFEDQLMRFTIRRLIVAISIVALGLALLIKPLYDRKRWWRISDYHREQSKLFEARWESARDTDHRTADKLLALYSWHSSMAARYGRAAAYPYSFSTPRESPPPFELDPPEAK
jgi:hypothetical protein